MKSKQEVKISVVMPVYNEEKYLGEAIESILNQTFTDFEFIIVDDGSRDKSVEILKSYAQKDARIKLILNDKNKGNYPCRNEGMKMAKGKYIAVMDADDVAMQQRLQVQFDYMEKNVQISVVGTNFEFYDKVPFKLPPAQKRRDAKPEQLKIQLLTKTCFLHPSLLFRASIIKKMHGYNERYTYAADYDLICRIALHGEYAILKDIMIKYRWHSSQISQKHKCAQNRMSKEIRCTYNVEMIKQLKMPIGYKTPMLSDVSFTMVGVAIYLYSKFQLEKDKRIEKEADNIMDKISGKIKMKMSICLSDGLCGLGCGIMYILRNKFMEGNEDDILAEVDNALHTTAISNVEMDNSWSYGLCGLICYIRRRLMIPSSTNYKFNLKTLELLLEKLDRQKDYNDFDADKTIYELKELSRAGLHLEKSETLLNYYIRKSAYSS